MGLIVLEGGPSDLGSPAVLEGLLGCVPPRPLAIVEGEAHEGVPRLVICAPQLSINFSINLI